MVHAACRQTPTKHIISTTEPLYVSIYILKPYTTLIKLTILNAAT